MTQEDVLQIKLLSTVRLMFWIEIYHRWIFFVLLQKSNTGTTLKKMIQKRVTMVPMVHN